MKIQFINNFYINRIKRPNASPSIGKPQLKLNNLTFDTFERSSKIAFLGSTRCSEQNFQVKNIDNIRCPACGLITLTDEQIKTYIRDVADKKGQDLVDAFEKYEDESIITQKENPQNKSIYRPMKQKIINIIKELALEYPQMDLKQLVILKASECINDLVEKQLEVLYEMEHFIKQNVEDPNTLQEFLKILDEHKERAKGKSDKEFANKRLLYALKKINCSQKVKDGLTIIGEKLPTSKNDIYSFFVKYSKSEYTPGAIASKFVAESIPTAEHLIPKSNNGPNKLENYICDCADCNSKRSSIPFYIWQNEIPDFEKNLQQYLDDVQKGIDDGILDVKYQSYIENIIDVLRKLSHNKINLTLPDSKNAQIIQATNDKRQTEVNKIYTSMDILSEQISALKREIAEIESLPPFRRIIQSQIVAKRLNSTQKAIKEKREELSSLKQEKAHLQEILNTCTRSRKNKKKIQYTPEEIAQTKQALNELEVKIKQEEKALLDLKKTLETLTQKERTISRTIPSIATINEKINDYKTKIEAIKALEQKRREVSKIEIKKAELEAKKAELEQQSAQLTQQNSDIATKESFCPDNKKEYYKYLHLLELIKTCFSMISEQNQKKSRIPNAKEVLNIAKDAVLQSINSALELDSVLYFVNLETINTNNRTIKDLDKKINELSVTYSLLNNTIVELSRIGSGENLDNLQARYDNALAEKSVLMRISTISAKRQELEMLEDTREYNRTILSRLKDFRTMSNEEFKQLISSFYCEN